MKKQLIRLLFCAGLLIGLLTVGASAGYSGSPTQPKGAGTAESPYQISSAEELYWFAGLVNGDKNIIGNDTEKNTAAHAVLTADITIQTGVLKENGTLNGDDSNFTKWTTIYDYTGTFDGGGHTISGLYVNIQVTSGTVCAGLFGTVSSGGVVKDLTIADSYVSGAVNDSISAYAYVGGVCGGNSGTITGCSNRGTVTGSAAREYAYAYVGGVCGGNTGTITNCWNSGAVTGTAEGNDYAYASAGGVCGWNKDGGTITNCWNRGAVTGTATGSGAYVGGVCGSNSSTITNCCWLKGTAGDTGIGYGGGGATSKTADQFASGEVAWLLNGGEQQQDGPWRQSLGNSKDSFPVLDSTHSKVYRVIFEVEDQADQTGYYNSPVTLPDAPGTRPGYTFSWSGGSTTYEAGQTVPLTADITFTGQWTANVYTVTLNPNGGTINNGNITSYTYDTGATLPTDVTRPGYTFAGWYDDEELMGNLVTAIPADATDNKEYWAKWTVNTYNITYELNGGTASDNPTSYTVENEAITLNNPTRTGYTFAGWTGTGLSDASTNVTISTGSTGDRTYIATWTANTYTVSYEANGGEGTMDAQPFTYDTPQALAANAFTRSGYTFAGWNTAADGSGTGYSDGQTVSNLTTTPGGTVTLYAQWTANPTSGGGGSTPTKTPSQLAIDKIGAAKEGSTVKITLTASKTMLDKEVFEALAGRDVTLEITVPGGVSWTVNGQDIPTDADLTDLDMGVTMDTSTIPVDVINAITGETGTIQLTLAHDGEFGFTLTLTAPLGAEHKNLWANLYHYDEGAGAMTFQTAARVDESGNVALRFTHASQYAIVLDDKSHELPFTDVPEGAWYVDSVAYVYRHDLMAGYENNLFGPDDDLSRAQLCQILYNLEGQPAVTGGSAFTDVADGAWYFDAVTWAAANGIVTGYGNGKFGPEDNITREQLAAMLHRYAQSMGCDVSIGEDTSILSYADAPDVSEYAVAALQWACGAGIITGTGDGSTLSPQGQATRAEAAAMLMRFGGQYGG